MVRALPALFACLSVVATLPAHGGQYRGQWAPAAPIPGLPGPGSGGPAGPSSPTPGPTTGGRPASPETANWQTWWEFNKEPFLLLRKVEDKTPTTGSDDFYLGRRHTEARVDTLAPTPSDLQDKIVPTLARLLGAEHNRDIQSACLVALGKVGRDGKGVELEKTIVPLLARDDQEVRETAVLSLGIAGRDKAMPILTALVRGDAEGKRLSDRAEVSDRTRAFAAYALGLLAMRSDDGALKRQVHDLLWELLQDKEIKSRDMLTAAVTGLGLLHAERSAHKRLAWQTVEELLAWYQTDLGRGDEIVQAHAPVAIGRLLGRGSSPLHQRCKEHFALVLNASQRRSNPILQSAALALGMLSVPAEENADDAAFARALQQHYDRGHDRQARWFSVMALGRIGGTGNRAWLLAAYEKSSKAVERPWVGLALGLIADASLRRGEIDTEVAEILLRDLRMMRGDDVRAALAVAIGLCGHVAAVPTVMQLLRDEEGQERLAGYLCVSLALLGDTTTAPALTAVLERSQRRPFLLQQAAVALGRLGDKNAMLRLLEMLQRSESVAVLSAIAVAIGDIGDRRAIDALVEQAGNAEITKLGRAFVAAALGGVGDKDVMPWNVQLSVDSNYAAAVDTLTNGATGVLDIL